MDDLPGALLLLQNLGFPAFGVDLRSVFENGVEVPVKITPSRI
jgi:hypothetical protein